MTTTSQGFTVHTATAEQQQIVGLMRLAPAPAEEINRVWLAGGGFDLARLTPAIQATVDAHDMLRARLDATDGNVELVVFDRAEDVELTELACDADGLVATVQAMLADDPLEQRDRWFQAMVVTLPDGAEALVLRMHHGLVDGISVAIVENEIWSRYLGQQVAEGATQFSDYSRSGATDISPQSRQWWRATLAGAEPTTPRPVGASSAVAFTAAQVPISIESSSYQRVRQLARAHRTSPLAVLLAAHLMTLAAFTGDDDVVSATPYMNRDDPACERLVGPLVNLLPVRVRITGNRIEDGIAAVAEYLRAAIGHARVPFGELLAEANSARDDAYGLVKSILGVVAGEGTGAAASVRSQDGNPICQLPLSNGFLRMDLAVTLADESDRFTGALVYRADRYGEPFAAAFRDHFLALLDGAPMPPATVSARSPEASGRGDDRSRLDFLLHLTPFTGPDAPVTVEDGRSTDAASFAALVDSFERELDGCEPRPRVGLGLPTGTLQLAALLAVWRRGGCAVLLDRRMPAERRAAAEQEAGVALTWTQAPQSSQPPAERTGQVARTTPAATDTAYIVFTSGTDGRPKGVCVSYANLTYLIGVLHELDAALPGQNPLSPAFDGWLWASLLPLVHGEPVCFIGAGAAGIRRQVLGRDSSVTLTPTMLAELGADALPAVVISAGEPLPAGLAGQVPADRRLINAYGPTEGSVCASWADRSRHEDISSVGRSCLGAEISIRDRQGQPAPRWAVGEVWLSGAGLAAGYLDRAELTAAQFVLTEHGRWYRTGDAGYVDSDGLLHLVGRIDRQVKIAGVRIEPEETVAVLRACPGVRDAAAVISDDTGSVELVAVVVLEDPGTAEGALTACEAACAQRLLPEGRPAHIAVVPRLPMTANGKLDEKALRSAVTEQRAAPAATGEGSPTMRVVADIWSQVLGRPVTDFDLSFFDYGGHSLAASRVIGMLRKTFARPVPTLALFKHPTVRQLAGWLDDEASST
jgi:non-ribosomal peptide synthetase component F/acyl carrier protein